jgi:glycerol-3-phosphate dehydrogenase
VLPRIRAICQPELGWDDDRWETEEAAYCDLWRNRYSLPDRQAIPDWRAMLAQARLVRASARPVCRKKLARGSVLAGVLVVVALFSLWFYWRRQK